MSFGKDSSNLAGMPIYGGSQAQRAANAGRKKNRNYGNKRPYWADTFRPDESQVSGVRLLPGDYEVTRVNDQDQLITEKTAWYEFVEHYSGSARRGGICSGGPWFFNKAKREPCLGCDKRDAEGNRGKNVKKTMSRSDKFVFAVLDMGLFHQVQQIDRTNGRVRLNQSNEPYLEWVKCTLRGCQNCHVALQNRYGYVQPWIMPKQHFNALNGYAPQIGTCCVTCGGRQTISSIAWLCGNQQCRTPIFDMKTTTFTDEQIGQVVNEPYGCRVCQQTFYPEEIIACSGCAQFGRQPVRATIFDVDLHVKAPKTGENDMTVLQVVGMSDPQPINPHFAPLLEYKPDLKRRFAPSTMEEQAQSWVVTRTLSKLQQGHMAQPGSYLPAGAPLPGGVPAPGYTQPYGQQPVQHPMTPQPQYMQPPMAPQYAQAPAPAPAPTQYINGPYASPVPQQGGYVPQPPTQPQYAAPAPVYPPQAPQIGYGQPAQQPLFPQHTNGYGPTGHNQ